MGDVTVGDVTMGDVTTVIIALGQLLDWLKIGSSRVIINLLQSTSTQRDFSPVCVPIELL